VPVASIVECMATSRPLKTSVAKPNTGKHTENIYVNIYTKLSCLY
jgi:hypothetical protein